MGKKGETGSAARALRRRAEARLAGEGDGAAGTEGRDPLALVHEFQVYQIELEMQKEQLEAQNEELRRAHAAADELRERYQDLYDFAPVAYAALDEQGMLREANLACATLLETTRDSLLKGRFGRFDRFLAPPSRPAFNAFVTRTLGADTRQSCEVALIGRRPPVHLLVEGIAFAAAEGGKHVRMVLIDVSERKRFEEEILRAREAAEAASAAKGQFLANMSHELRTPMTGVLGMLDMALGKELGPDLRHYLETAAGSARSLLRLLNDILDVTRIEAGKLSLEAAPFDLRECARNVIDLFAPEARRKGFDLTLRMADDLPAAVIGDRMRLFQVLANLVGNAVKFTEAGEVRAELTADAPSAAGERAFIFAVTDTGIGIPAEKQGILFRRFSQADESHTRRFGGAGLGLAISREIATLMGGTISCTSREGIGSTFTFTFAFPVGETPAISDRGAPHPQALGGRMPRLLLVEDDPVTRELMELMLRLANFELTIAEDGRQGVEQWEKGRYDLVLMDVQMPGMDGFEATRIIRDRERERGGHVPILALTAHAQKEDEEKCLAAGMDGCITKPVDFSKCVEVITELIDRRG